MSDKVGSVKPPPTLPLAAIIRVIEDSRCRMVAGVRARVVHARVVVALVAVAPAVAPRPAARSGANQDDHQCGHVQHSLPHEPAPEVKPTGRISFHSGSGQPQLRVKERRPVVHRVPLEFGHGPGLRGLQGVGPPTLGDPGLGDFGQHALCHRQRDHLGLRPHHHRDVLATALVGRPAPINTLLDHYRISLHTVTFSSAGFRRKRMLIISITTANAIAK